MDTIPKYPSPGASKSGSAISALTPHTTVVSPKRTSEEPSAVDIEPGSEIGQLLKQPDVFWEHLPTLIEQSLNSWKALPSGLTFSSKNRSRYIFGCRRWNVAALVASEGVEEAAIPQTTAYTGKGRKSRSCLGETSATSAHTPVHNPNDPPTGGTALVSRLQAAEPKIWWSFYAAATWRLFRSPS